MIDDKDYTIDESDYMLEPEYDDNIEDEVPFGIDEMEFYNEWVD